MGKRVCAVILVLAMILCQMPSVTAKAVSPGGEAQYLEVGETQSAVTEEVQSAVTEEVQSAVTGEVQSLEIEEAQSPGEGEEEAADEENALDAEDPAAGITVADEQSEETSEGAQDEGAGEGAPAGETSESAQVEEAGENAQPDETGDAAQTAETGEDTRTGETVDDVQTAETVEDEQAGDSESRAEIEETVEAEQAENAAETAKAGNPDYAGEEDELDDDTIAAPRNLRWEDRTGKWDAVKGAEKYKVELFRIGEDGQAKSVGTATPTACEFTFSRIDISITSLYYFTVRAIAGDSQSAAARSEEAEFGPVPAPGNPRWDGKTARWDAVEGQTSYCLWLNQVAGEEDGKDALVLRRWIRESVCEADLSEVIDAAGDGRFYFTVRACTDDEDNWAYNSYGYTFADSPVASFGNPDLIKLPTPDDSDLKFKIPESGHLVATWKAPTGLDSDVGYKYRVTLYKDDLLFRTVDCDRGTLSYDFTASGDAPMDSASEFYFGVRYVPTEEETRYCAGLEETMYSWDAVTPGKDLVRSLEGTRIDLIRAGDTKLSFWPAWTGAYGDAWYILLKVSITKADGTKQKAMWAGVDTLGHLTYDGMGHSYNRSNPFEKGDVVSFEATLTDSNYYNSGSETISGKAYATWTETRVIKAAGAHTVRLKANGKGKDSSVTVADNTYLTQAEGYWDALPSAAGYSIAGFSTLKKGLGQYTRDDLYMNKVTEDMTLYAVWVPAIDKVEINISTPVCGAEITSASYTPDANGPEITLPMDAPYVNESWFGSNWYTKAADGSTKTFIGKIRGGQVYYTAATIADKQLGDERIVSTYAKNFVLTGNFRTGEVLTIRPQYKYTTFADLEFSVMAEHDWGEWTTVKKATDTEDGLRRRVCKGCDEKEEEVIPSTGAATITVTTDGNGTASASADHASAGKTVTLTAKPNAGYRFYKWEVISGGVSVKNNAFTIGKDNVEIKAVFGKIPGKSGKVTVYNVAQGIKVTWLKVPDATSYYIYRDDLDGKGYKFLFRTSALEVTDLEVRYQLGKKFRYKVLATSKYGGDAEGFRTSTYYRLMPTGITSVKNTGAGKMTVTYDKSSGGSGYVVRYGLKKDMSDAKVITVKGENTTTRTFSGLRKGQTYYVQARTYKIEDGIRYYSGYCLTKTVKIVK